MCHYGWRAYRGVCASSSCHRRPRQLRVRPCPDRVRPWTRRHEIPCLAVGIGGASTPFLPACRSAEARVMTPPQAAVPLATYPLQLHRGFPFADATRTVSYLHTLGITDCYLSPISKATPGSDHGYDVIDPVVLNPELGSEKDFQEFAQTVRAHGMGLLLDVVPNHMGIGRTLNRWWRDVLENGPSSRYATAFDIEWHPIKRELENKVLLPILGDQYGAVLEKQEMELVYGDRAFLLRYGD